MTTFSSGDKVRVLDDWSAVKEGEIVTLGNYVADYASWWIPEKECHLSEKYFERVDSPARAVKAPSAPVQDGKSTLPDNNPKTVYGLQKPSTASIPPAVVLLLGQVMANGAAKYGRFNWRDKKVTASVYTDAIDRHLLSWRDGEDIDPESGLPHLAHVMACCSILLDAEGVGKLNDDRSKTGQVSRHIDGSINKDTLVT